MIKADQLSTSSETYRERLVKRKQVIETLNAIFEENKLDVILYPHQKRLVCKVGDSQLERNGVLASVTGFPSICMPAGFSSVTGHAPLGVPIGMEVLGKFKSEDKLINIARKIESLLRVRKSPESVNKG